VDEVELVEMYLHIVSTPAVSVDVRTVLRKELTVTLEYECPTRPVMLVVVVYATVVVMVSLMFFVVDPR
jgi:hypothetical protein